MTRPLSSIVADIRQLWPKLYFRAMLAAIRDTPCHDLTPAIVLYFLAHTHSWQGVRTRRLRAELHTRYRRSEV